MRYGGSYVISGRVRNADSTPGRGRAVSILIGDRKPLALGDGDRRPRRAATASASSRARTGMIHAGFRPPGRASDLACSRKVRSTSAPGLTLSATPKRVRAGRACASAAG